MAGRKNQSRDVAPMIRGAFKRACLALEQGGTPLSTLMIESLKSDFTGTLRAVSSFTPKELEVVTMPKRIEDMSEEELMRRSTEAYDKAMPSPEPGEQKPRRMAKGGTASARADGIATKGKTRGTMVSMCGGGMARGKK